MNDDIHARPPADLAGLLTRLRALLRPLQDETWPLPISQADLRAIIELAEIAENDNANVKP